MTQDSYIRQLENMIKSLESQIANLTETVKYLTDKMYGSSSEKTKSLEIDGQFNLFNEAEAQSDKEAPEPFQKDLASFRGSRVKKPKATREELLKDFPVVEIPCELPEDDRECPQCGGELVYLAKEIVREELQFIPAQLKRIRYIRYAYECPKCRQEDTPYIEKASTPTPLMKHSLASPSTVAWSMYQKYANGMPLYRQESDWLQQGLKISRATLANWIIYCSQHYFYLLIERMKKELLARDVLHADETTVQVLKEDGKTATSKSYMWLYRTGDDGQAPIVLYEYQPSRAGQNAARYLEGFQGFLHTDGYQGYGKVEGIIRCGCWAHLRRYFIDAIPAKAESNHPAVIGRSYCDKLFQVENKLASLPPQERKAQRLKQESPVLEAFWCWLDTVTYLNGSRLGKAVKYAQNQHPIMENYLLDGKCSLSNNTAENSIRPFAIGRKNWLFSDTAKGASASAAVYSLIETAKANGLNIYHYLNQVLLYMPGYLKESAGIDELLPWSDTMQSRCKLKKD